MSPGLIEGGLLVVLSLGGPDPHLTHGALGPLTNPWAHRRRAPGGQLPHAGLALQVSARQRPAGPRHAHVHAAPFVASAVNDDLVEGWRVEGDLHWPRHAQNPRQPLADYLAHLRHTMHRQSDDRRGGVQEFALGGAPSSLPLPLKSRVPLKPARGCKGAL